MIKKSGIYKLSWPGLNDYFYYGQTANFYFRKAHHLSKLFKKKHANVRIQRVFNKYGPPTIKLVKLCNPEELDLLEQRYLDKYIGVKSCLNLYPTAKTALGFKHSKKTRQKMSKSGKLKIFTEEHKKNISLGRTGVKAPCSEKRKALLSKFYKGKQLSEQHKAAIKHSISKWWCMRKTKGEPIL